MSQPIQPFTRSRVYATSKPPLNRQPAFRLQRSYQAFLQTPQPEDNPTPEELRSYAPRKSRIPVPESPAHLDLNLVQDFSAVLPSTDTLRRSSRMHNRPDFYGTRVQDAATGTYRRGDTEKKQMFRER